MALLETGPLPFLARHGRVDGVLGLRLTAARAQLMRSDQSLAPREQLGVALTLVAAAASPRALLCRDGCERTLDALPVLTIGPEAHGIAYPTDDAVVAAPQSLPEVLVLRVVVLDGRTPEMLLMWLAVARPLLGRLLRRWRHW